MDRSSYRKRNVSDGDSGFESALSSRSSSISLEESQELAKYLDPQISKVETCVDLQSFLRKQFSNVLSPHEDIVQDVSDPELYLITDKLTGRETLYKPPSKLKFSSDPPQVEETYSSEDYCRSTPIPRSQLFNSRLAYELEKQVDKMDLVEVDLVIDPKVVPPPSLGIRVIGVNMIHGIPDKLNIYVKRVLEGSLAGNDGRITVNDHIIEVNGTSLVGVGQKLAADTLSSCAINPNTGVVRFVVAREKKQPAVPATVDEGIGEEVNDLNNNYKIGDNPSYEHLNKDGCEAREGAAASGPVGQHEDNPPGFQPSHLVTANQETELDNCQQQPITLGEHAQQQQQPGATASAVVSDGVDSVLVNNCETTLSLDNNNIIGPWKLGPGSHWMMKWPQLPPLFSNYGSGQFLLSSWFSLNNKSFVTTTTKTTAQKGSSNADPASTCYFWPTEFVSTRLAGWNVNWWRMLRPAWLLLASPSPFLRRKVSRTRDLASVVRWWLVATLLSFYLLAFHEANGVSCVVSSG